MILILDDMVEDPDGIVSYPRQCLTLPFLIKVQETSKIFDVEKT